MINNCFFRKVEGEAKGAGGHGDGEGVFDGTSVPLRRWEDWERSRLRKIRREERRRREMEQRFPVGYSTENGSLGIRSQRSSTQRSSTQYEPSDTTSVLSSDDDHWGPQIGGYNENNPAYPPPPTGVLLPRAEMLNSANTVNATDLEAMLEVGFESEKNLSRQNLLPGMSSSNSNLPRFQLSDGAPVGGNGYAPVDVMSPVSPTGPGATSSAIGTSQTHARRRSGGRAVGGGSNRYGPLGPLDPGNRI